MEKNHSQIFVSDLQLFPFLVSARIKDIKVAKDRIVCQAGYLHGLANVLCFFGGCKGHCDDIQEMYMLSKRYKSSNLYELGQESFPRIPVAIGITFSRDIPT